MLRQRAIAKRYAFQLAELAWCLGLGKPVDILKRPKSCQTETHALYLRDQRIARAL